ncbi:Multidrug resistance-associated protein 1 [Mortierella claussenii]|nr:Multidrug resistance-associated protein 1 [Mortierella claussenii]
MSSVCELETIIVLVEPVKEYSKLTPEAPYGILDSKRTRARLSLTGSGFKPDRSVTVMTIALSRVIEVTEGKILFNGFMSTVGLQELRLRLTIISQDLFLFGGTPLRQSRSL